VRTRTNADTGGSTTTTWDQGTTTLGWGPNGHPLVVANGANATAPYLTLHWDGDIILFITDASGNVIDFKVGLEGEIAPRDPTQSALVAYERDIAGVIIGSSVNGATSLAPLDAWDGTGPNFGGLNYAPYTRPDGFEIGGIQINGVRAFDPALGAWTTPDAYEGNIHDPASQQKYMWNRGNPVEYSDPSGYVSYVGVNSGQESVGSGMGHEMVIVVDAKDPRKGTLYSWRPSGTVKSGKNLVHTPGHTDIHTGLIKDLMSKSYDWHSVNTSVAQDAKIAAIFKTANDKENFNLASNSCADMILRAYSEADHPISEWLTRVPAATEFQLNHFGYPGGAAVP
jgi:RHS repeat-associated protein